MPVTRPPHSALPPVRGLFVTGWPSVMFSRPTHPVLSAVDDVPVQDGARLSVQPPVPRTLECVDLSALMNNAAVNTLLQVLMWIFVFVFLGYIPGIDVARSHGNCTFDLWRNCQTAFQLDCAVSRSHQKQRGFQCPHVLGSTCLSFLFSAGHPP